MSNTKISGIFTIESKDKKISQSNMVVGDGARQLFSWFKMANYAKKPTGKAREVLFSKCGIERINISDLTVLDETVSDETVLNETISAKIINDNGNEVTGYTITNVGNSIDGNDKTYLESKYRGSSYRRTIKLSFEKNPLNLRGIALYGKETERYDSYSGSTNNTGTITIVRNFVQNEIKYYAKTTFQTQVLLTPHYNYSGVSLDDNGNLSASRNLYVYITFNEHFNSRDWDLYTETKEKTGTQKLDKNIQCLEGVTEIEIIDRDYAYMQINEIDVYTCNNNYYEAPHYFKVGTGATETIFTTEKLESEITGIIKIEETYLTEDGKVRYVGYLSGDDIKGGVREIGVFFNQGDVEKMFARTVLPESFEIPEGCFAKITYDLEVE